MLGIDFRGLFEILFEMVEHTHHLDILGTELARSDLAIELASRFSQLGQTPSRIGHRLEDEFAGSAQKVGRALVIVGLDLAHLGGQFGVLGQSVGVEFMDLEFLEYGTEVEELDLEGASVLGRQFDLAPVLLDLLLDLGLDLPQNVIHVDFIFCRRHGNGKKGQTGLP